ncbi:carbohydrate ABC transporter permease [Loktanella sp. DJP18]|uniref:carbohydrate ABC transporter permease n=1 Tax=Loktanella sp. DJP18 TaxID=3409788 RepID=UPI003BB6DCBB
MADVGILATTKAAEQPVHRTLDAGPRGAKPKKRMSRSNIIIYGTLFVMSLYYALPLYVMIVTSLKGMPEIRMGNIFAPPLEITFQPWVKAWQEACTGINCDGLSRGFWNSVRILIPSVIVSVAIASVNGYALSMWKFNGSEVFFTILMIGAFIPYQVMLYPIVILLRDGGTFFTDTWQNICPIITLGQGTCNGEVQLYGSLTGLVLVHVAFGMPINTLLFRNYFSSIPEELFKAARVDGAGFWAIFFKIMMPMSLPIFVVALIIQVTGIWNDFLFGVTYISSPDRYPMTVQLNNIVNSVQGVKEYNVNMAATLLTGLVPLVIYFASGKLFVRGIAAGAVKG